MDRGCIRTTNVGLKCEHFLLFRRGNLNVFCVRRWSGRKTIASRVRYSEFKPPARQRICTAECRPGSLNVSLGELRVQQLQTGLTTPFGFNVLVTFDNVYYESSGATAPGPTSTQVRLVGFTFEECSKCGKSKAGLVAHHRVHDYDRVGTNKVATLACANCSRLFPTKIGLSLLCRHARPTKHNADKLGRVKYSGTRWSKQESQSLLLPVNNLNPSCGTQMALFARLEQYFPGRSAISIKNRLWMLNWRTLQDESSGEPEQTIGQTTAYSSEAYDYSIWSRQTVDCTVSLLEPHADSSLASVDFLAFSQGLQSGTMTPEQVLSLWTSLSPGHFHTPERLYTDADLGYPSDPGQPKADPPSHLHRHPDRIPPKMERCSVCYARWVME
ncbi:hypothetical protein T265_01232 [Opisthorchis viverrini]|uniref:C2H2-type domain-containing protein n=1 Tax=Opisthorchis viverrini TaxID=6198 RepID=A0A075AAF7_OPIVI|nr:hypothetical protein T265_01232 [Opisthorchis viverrini]KER32745.1 hypothetical protein T265_01232 [Opisthorchis viverrini]